MAKVDKLRPEVIEQSRGTVDFYLLRGILPVARAWPKKPKPPYTALQAEAMAVFSIICGSMKRIYPSILLAWQIGSEGKRAQWTDTYKGLGMKYWKKNRSIAPVAIDYKIVEEEDKFSVSWTVLQLYIEKSKEEEIKKMSSDLINKEDILSAPKPIYFSLYDDFGTRVIAPFIKFEVTA